MKEQKQSMNWKSEAQFQSQCFRWFDREYPEQRGRLILIYNNPPNPILGSLLKSMGMRKGSSDHFYFYGYLKIAFIEFKTGYDKQSEDQLAFEALVRSCGFDYFLIRSKILGDISEFTNLIKRLNYGR